MPMEMREAEDQWLRAGGHVLAHAPPSMAGLAEKSRATFALLQTATSLDVAAETARAHVRDLNTAAPATGKRTRVCVCVVGSGERRCKKAAYVKR